MANILITGAAGVIGTEVSAHLVDHHNLTLVDVAFNDFPDSVAKKATLETRDLTKQENWEGLLNGIDYIIQLAADPDPEADFYDSLLDLNYKLPHNLYIEAKKSASLKRIIFASSIHAVDAYPQGVQVKTNDPVRPNDLYGVSKVYLEGLASYYAFMHGIESIGIRIGDYKADDSELPNRPGPHGFATYLSSRDFNHLIDCCLDVSLKEPYLLLNGLSNNLFNRLDIQSAKVEVGYTPTDDAFEKREFVEKK